MSLIFAWEKLFLAVTALCGPGSQSARLANATTHYLVHLRPDDLPSDLRREFVKLTRDLKTEQARGEEARIQATISSLDASVREQAIRRILHIFSSACRHLGG